MNRKKHKEEDSSKIQRRREGDEWHRKREDREQILNFDFAQIEDEPGTDLEKQTVKKLAKVPSPQDILIDQEEMEVLIKVIPLAKLSPVQTKCIELTLEGLTPQQISERLGRGYTTVEQQMGRGLAKLLRYMKQKKYLI